MITEFEKEVINKIYNYQYTEIKDFLIKEFDLKESITKKGFNYGKYEYKNTSSNIHIPKGTKSYLISKNNKDNLLYYTSNLIALLENEGLIVKHENPHNFFIICYSDNNHKEKILEFNLMTINWFDKLIFQTTKLEKFIKNGYMTYDELNYKKEQKSRKWANARSIIISIVAICASLLPFFIDRCENKEPTHIVIDKTNSTCKETISNPDPETRPKNKNTGNN